jgi:hypothetical protein
VSVKSSGGGALSGMTPAGMSQLLFRLSGANMQSTADQIFTKIYSGTSYFITSIVARQRTGAATVACAGGIYTGAAKTGDQLVALAQSWVTLAAGVIVQPTLAALIATNLETATPILSLTTGSTGACTADIFIYGVDIT